MGIRWKVRKMEGGERRGGRGWRKERREKREVGSILVGEATSGSS